ncbi:MAG: phosphate ABC transporter permease [Epulopiscium sp. Nele67-Bin002]|nr:MAG: phosphate ABC transporter permease subunit PstC [Epulopiscium sp. Nuni2H_MBin001]OON90831.1 MAG: phosphate ABC transporter permease [Epulopiscium sp. Nele67-Bin002]OON92184.1 MAG: phosphate ABC transporter permease subunit PstC [Epulopiscium sp. Nele67-Bin001]
MDIMKWVFRGCAALTIVAISVIGFFIIFNGLSFFTHTSLWSFLTGQYWLPSGEIFGIFPMLVSSFFATLGSVTIGILIGVSTAIVLVELLPAKLASILSKMIDLLAGIPSVIYGFFGLMVIVPLIKNNLGGSGLSLLAVIIILTFMILPTIIRMTEVSLKAVPREYKEGAYALGATRLQYIFKVQLRSAKSGIIAGIMLAIGRALGETMAVMLVAGNAVIIPENILSAVRTVTANIAMEMSYASGVHEQALFATGLVLFAIIIGINILMQWIVRRLDRG